MVDPYEEARARAARAAPPPSVEPTTAGIAGLFLAGIGIALFTATAGMSSDDEPLAVGVVAAAAFLGPFLWFKQQERAHLAALSPEMRETDRRVGFPCDECDGLGFVDDGHGAAATCPKCQGAKRRFPTSLREH